MELASRRPCSRLEQREWQGFTGVSSWLSSKPFSFFLCVFLLCCVVLFLNLKLDLELKLKLELRRYEVAEKRKPATGFFDMIENFAMPEQLDYGARAAELRRRQMRALRAEQKKYLRGVMSVPDAIR